MFSLSGPSVSFRSNGRIYIPFSCPVVSSGRCGQSFVDSSSTTLLQSVSSVGTTLEGLEIAPPFGTTSHPR